MSRKTWRLLITALCITILGAGYWFYGRGVSAITLIDHGTAKQSIFNRVTQRQRPDVRVLLNVDNQPYYSEIVTLVRPGIGIKLEFQNGPLSYHLDELKILDARIKVGGDMLVVGQVLEEFTQPRSVYKGQRFEYRIHRRWHLF